LTTFFSETETIHRAMILDWIAYILQKTFHYLDET